MKSLMIFVLLSFLLLWNSAVFSLTPEEIQHEQALSELAKDRCNTEQIEGKDYSLKFLADGNVEVSFFGKKGGQIKGTFIYKKNEWEGRQRVLRENQASENKDRRKCIREELKSLRENYNRPSTNEVSSLGEDWLSALRSKDVNKLLWLSDLPFAFDGVILVSKKELQKEYQELITGFYDDGVQFGAWRFIGDPNEEVIVRGISVHSLMELATKSLDLKEAISTLHLRNDDLVVKIKITHIGKNSTPNWDLEFLLLTMKSGHMHQVVGALPLH